MKKYKNLLALLAIVLVVGTLSSCKAQKYGCPNNFSIELLK